MKNRQGIRHRTRSYRMISIERTALETETAPGTGTLYSTEVRFKVDPSSSEEGLIGE
jgi:hypothetical protein